MVCLMGELGLLRHGMSVRSWIRCYIES